MIPMYEMQLFFLKTLNSISGSLMLAVFGIVVSSVQACRLTLTNVRPASEYNAAFSC